MALVGLQRTQAFPQAKLRVPVMGRMRIFRIDGPANSCTNTEPTSLHCLCMHPDCNIPGQAPATPPNRFPDHQGYQPNTHLTRKQIEPLHILILQSFTAGALGQEHGGNGHGANWRSEFIAAFWGAWAWTWVLV
jgi:hypothetical protein